LYKPDQLPPEATVLHHPEKKKAADKNGCLLAEERMFGWVGFARER